jgi:hypothetical protein
MIRQGIAATVDDKLRRGGGSGACLLALGQPSRAAAESVIAEWSWILNYVIFRNHINIRPFIRLISIGHFS